MSVIDESGCTGYGVVERQVDSLVMPSDGKSLQIEFFYLAGGEDPFICGVNGAATTTILAEIEDEIVKDPGDLFDQGEGSYLFKACYEKGEYSPIDGRCENAPYWDLTLVSFKTLA